jgi:phospholipase C
VTVLHDLCANKGWTVDRHIRLVADVTGDGRGDLVGFGDNAVWVARSNGDGTFGPVIKALDDLCFDQGWRVDKHPRFVIDVNGDGKADLVGFGDAGVWVALSRGDGTFAAPQLVVRNLGFNQGWRVDKHPRFVVDVTGEGKPDLVGFGDAGVWVAVSNGDGTFRMPQFSLGDFGAASGSAGVKHVFVLMLENRSFDQMLGFSGITGTNAETGLPTAIDGLKGDEHNTAHREVFTVHRGARDTTDSPGHDFLDVLEQLTTATSYTPGGPYPAIKGAADSGYAQNYASRGSPQDVMNCLTEAETPILHQLAREFAVCDRWFSAMPGATFPNRFFVHAASSGGVDYDASDDQALTVKWATVSGKAFPHSHIFQIMDNADLEWSVYAGDSFPVASLLEDVDSALDVHNFEDEFAEDLNDAEFGSVRYAHIEPKYFAEPALTNFGDYSGGNSQHPRGSVHAGEALIKRTYEAIRNSPVWEDSLLIITWDEHGGFYDHVPPPRAVPPGDGAADDNKYGFVFDQLGPRVPAVIISPRIPQNTIDHRVYDHSSVPATIERIFGLDPMTHRDAAANAPHCLLTLMEPRKNTPTRLGDVVESPQPVARVWSAAELAKPIAEGGASGFLQVAMVTDLRMSPPGEHDAIRARVKAIKTYQEARDYTESVSKRARLARAHVRASRVRGPRLTSASPVR